MAARKLTVLQVLPDLDSGGVERGTLEVGRALVERGHRSLVMSAGGRLVEQLEADGSEHFNWTIGMKSFRTFLLVSKLRKFFVEQKVDVIHVRSRLPAWIVYLAWKKMNVTSRPKLVTTVHGFYSVSWYSAIMTKGEVVIAVSDSIKKYIQQNYPEVDEDRIKVIHRGINRAEYPYGYQPDETWLESWYRENPRLKGKKVITLPGRITRLKGHNDFIELISMLAANGLPVVGVIAGGVDPRKQAYFDELKQLVEEKKLQSSIVFTGHRPDLREVMAVSDIVLSLTKQPESFGRTTLEALSMGIPVCGCAHGGVKEQLEVLLPEGGIKVNDVSAVASLMEKWLVKLPEVSKDHDFLLNNMLDKTLAVYEDLLLTGK